MWVFFSKVPNILPHLFPTSSNRRKRAVEDALDSWEYYSLIQSSFQPEETFRVTLLLAKIMSRKSLTNLTNDELNLLARIIKVECNSSLKETS